MNPTILFKFVENLDLLRFNVPIPQNFPFACFYIKACNKYSLMQRSSYRVQTTELNLAGFAPNVRFRNIICARIYFRK